MHREEETGACSVARSLLDRGIVEWWGFRPLSLDLEDVASWIGRASPKLLAALWEITAATHARLRSRCEIWLTRGDIAADDQGRWQIVGSIESRLAEAGYRFDLRLAAQLGKQKLLMLEQVRRILACAVLEGRTFTAAAVARALQSDSADLIDFVDNHLSGALGPWQKASSIEVLLVGCPLRTIRRYSFTRSLHG